MGFHRNLIEKPWKWKLNFNIDKLNSPASRNLYFDVVDAFDRISHVTLDEIFEDIELGGKISLGDILYLYDQILNFSSIGQGSIEKIFDHYIVESPNLPLAISNIETEHDKGLRQMNISKEQFMAFILRNASKFSSEKGIVKFKGNTEIDTNVYLLPLQEVSTLANNYYYDAEKVISAFGKNLITINLVC